MNNQPAFDPLNATPEEEADMLAGYLDATAGRPPTRDTLAYAHGRATATNDKAGTVEAWQLVIAARLRARETGDA